ncbi:hypothetical protein EMIT036CA2_10153 [Chryseobacterium sp. IT-36CA2]
MLWGIKNLNKYLKSEYSYKSWLVIFILLQFADYFFKIYYNFC